MEAHNRKPVYFKSTNPGLAQVDEIASKLFQWDETGSTPFEVGQGESWMPPQETIGEYTIWSDTYTLGYTAEGVAGPIFFTDGAMGDDKILKIINAVAYRLGEPKFNDIAAAKAWALTETRIHVRDDSAAALLTSSGITSVGLLANYDSSDPNSYTGPYSGSGWWNWNDLTGNGHTAHPSPALGYNANIAGGVYEWLVEGTINDWLLFNESISISQFSPWVNPNQTIQMWVYLPDNQPIVIVKKQNLGNAGWSLTYNNNGSRDGYTINANGYGMGPYTPSGTGTNIDGWNLITMQWKDSVTAFWDPTESYVGWRLFINDNPIELPSYADNFDAAAPITAWSTATQETEALELFQTNGATGSYEYTGKIGAFSFYDRVLTEQEVIDNYNATKSRFGL